MYAYHMNQIAFTPFAFTADGARVIYVGPQDSTAGIYTASLDGSTNTRIADGYGFVVSPFADRVAAIDAVSMRDQSIVRVVASATGSGSFKFTTSSGTLIRAPTFVPGDRGLLYVEAPIPGGGPMALNYLSFVDGRATPIGRWTRSQLPVLGYPIGEIRSRLSLDRSDRTLRDRRQRPPRISWHQPGGAPRRARVTSGPWPRSTTRSARRR